MAAASPTIRERLAGFVHRHSHLMPRLEVTRLAVQIDGLPPALEGFRIAHLSDLHVGDGNWLPMRVEEAAETLEAERPDVLVNTGDYLFGAPSIDTVAGVTSRLLLRNGHLVDGSSNLAILGNHDYYAGDDVACRLVEALDSQQVGVLMNRTTEARREDRAVTFAGLDPANDGYEEALEALRSAPRPRIALVHEADIAERFPPDTADLVLAGHSHGGQVAIPGLTPFIVRRLNGSRYVGGPYTINGHRVYVNAGLGCTGVPLRFRAPPELTILRLVR